MITEPLVNCQNVNSIKLSANLLSFTNFLVKGTTLLERSGEFDSASTYYGTRYKSIGFILDEDLAKQRNFKVRIHFSDILRDMIWSSAM